MTESARPGDRAPWIVAGALGAVAIALAAVVIFVIHPDRSDKEKVAGAHGLTPTQQHAMDAAAQEVLNLTTYSRKTFDADYARTVAGATGDLLADLQGPTRKSQLLTQMQSGKFDLKGQVTNTAFEQEQNGKYAVLVSAQSFQITSDNKQIPSSRNRFELTLVRQKGKWLVTGLQTVGLI